MALFNPFYSLGVVHAIPLLFSEQCGFIYMGVGIFLSKKIAPLYIKTIETGCCYKKTETLENSNVLSLSVLIG